MEKASCTGRCLPTMHFTEGPIVFVGTAELAAFVLSGEVFTKVSQHVGLWLLGLAGFQYQG